MSGGSAALRREPLKTGADATSWGGDRRASFNSKLMDDSAAAEDSTALKVASLMQKFIEVNDEAVSNSAPTGSRPRRFSAGRDLVLCADKLPPDERNTNNSAYSLSEPPQHNGKPKCPHTLRNRQRTGRRSSDPPILGKHFFSNETRDDPMTELGEESNKRASMRVERRRRRQSIEIASANDYEQRVARRFEVVGSQFIVNSDSEESDDDKKEPDMKRRPRGSRPGLRSSTSKRLSATLRSALKTIEGKGRRGSEKNCQ